MPKYVYEGDTIYNEAAAWFRRRRRIRRIRQALDCLAIALAVACGLVLVWLMARGVM